METDTLTPCPIDWLELLLEGDAAFEAGTGLHLAEGYNEFPDSISYSLGRLQRGETTLEWSLYLFIHRQEQRVIGLGGYKDAPNAGGGIEFGYEIAPGYRGRGYATEAARALIDHALASPRVRMIYAHTLPERSASTAVLRKCGMVMTGQVIDPDDGRVWRWQIERPVRHQLPWGEPLTAVG